MILSFLSYIFSNLLFCILHVSPADSFPKALSAKKEKEYLEKMKEGDEDAKNKLIEHNLRLVAHVIKKYYVPNNNNQDDLVSIGTIGLIKAINTFDMSKGIRLSSYAARCIENEVLMFFRSNKKNSRDVSLNEPIDTDKDGNTLTLMDIMADDFCMIDTLDTKLKIEKLKTYMQSTLSNRESKILQLRYGLNSQKALTQREVAKLLNISRSYVSRIEKKALLKLKKKFEE